MPVPILMGRQTLLPPRSALINAVQGVYLAKDVTIA